MLVYDDVSLSSRFLLLCVLQIFVLDTKKYSVSFYSILCPPERLLVTVAVTIFTEVSWDIVKQDILRNELSLKGKQEQEY